MRAMTADTGESTKIAARPAGPLDPRRYAFRPDLAAKSLYGRVSAPRYAQGFAAQIVRAAVPLRGQPAATNGFLTEALFGETLTVYEERDGWAWIQLDRDCYVGYVPSDTVSQEIVEPTHRVRALGTFVYGAPDIKTPPLMHLSLNAEICVADADERFCQLRTGGFVVARHVTERDRFARDFVEIAERFIGTPYLWGGRTRLGVDCSGLVQISLEAAGVSAPRDTDMQQAELGIGLGATEVQDGLRRGDLVFWKGHVGLMVDGVTLLHANAHHMAVALETLPEAVQRIAKAGVEIAAVKRLPGLSA
jgi:cell wall-associated NlpC family hydrolase